MLRETLAQLKYTVPFHDYNNLQLVTIVKHISVDINFRKDFTVMREIPWLCTGTKFSNAFSYAYLLPCSKT